MEKKNEGIKHNASLINSLLCLAITELKVRYNGTMHVILVQYTIVH